MTHRRYQDDEVREIFERASLDRGSDGGSVASSDGLSLEELKKIGQEAGLSAESVQRAAFALDRGVPAAVRRRPLGIPLSVNRTTPLDRPLDDFEWEILVGELRRTFQARGEQESLGQTRQWTNGNLHVFIEPGGAGYRLRMGTLRSDAAAFGVLGASLLAVGIFILFVLLFDGGGAGKLAFPLGVMGAGTGMLVVNVLRLFPWARTREDQFLEISERTRQLIASRDGSATQVADAALTDPDAPDAGKAPSDDTA